MIKRFLRNPWITFLPFLLYYVLLVVKNKWPTLYGDEVRYVFFARNMLHGYYSPPAPYINLWSGPGYPVFLVPFIGLKIHGLYITMLNAGLLYLAVVVLYKAIKLVADHKTALLFSLALALYPNAWSVLPILYTEPLTFLLISGFVYCLARYYVGEKRKYLIGAGLLLGYIALTKIIFGYVIVICLAICLLQYLIKKRKSVYLRQVYVLLIAFAVTAPYLAYTLKMTGKIFYWGNSGGMSLYWMSTPHDNEYGDWKLPELTNNQYPTSYKSAETVAILRKNHKKEIDFILKHGEIEQDALFKRIAIRNIEAHPLKFVANYYYNCSRMLFNFPYSYAYQDASIVKNIIIGSLILWLSVAGLVVTYINRRSIIPPVRFALLITFVYLLLSGALSSYPRQLDIMMPILFFWLGYLKFNIKKPSLQFTVIETVDDISLAELTGEDIVQHSEP